MSSGAIRSERQPLILVVDDEKNLRDVLEYNLKREGYGVTTTGDGQEAVHLAYSEQPDLVILDIMLPGMNGYDVCRAIRKQLNMPILVLSAREEEIDKVLGLELGADDYMTKPFGLREMLARVRAMLRRAGYHESMATEASPQVSSRANTTQSETRAINTATDVLLAGDLIIDQGQRAVTHAGQLVEMKPKEFDLLTFLMSHPLQVFSRQTLLDRVWGYDFVGGTRTVDVHVSWLRGKLESDPANPRFIQTVHGVGYKFGVPVVARHSSQTKV
jgi:DNA-binding response OmpR family regulator